MARFSHIVVSIINILALLLSIFTISVSVSLIRNGPTKCNDPNPIKYLLSGVFLFCLSLVALIGAIRANRRLLSVYAGALFLWFLWLIGSSAFLLVLSNVSDAKADKDHKEYKLSEYPGWLRRYVVGGERWVPIKRCMSCCQPPSQCGFISKNDTSWEVPKSGILSGDPDCQSWSNNLDQVCYDCNSCKAGYLRTLKDSWLNEARFDLLYCVAIFVGFWIAFWAFRQAPREDNFHQLTGNIASVA
ncbi:hypothetical protein Vadar_003000 [Vaccinium darrowii]|uniref:Uncharacterized protein n=1 Tax=Vaccinium darrowii TaxID=229202 RepID=A0ACB7YCG3_9ERIC|nr:hypothetical protein Vadar_003000 [Vaccinium darrowii]